MDGLYFYKLVSNYPEDVTKNCKLTVNEIDGNFLTLKDADIKSYDFDCETNILTLTRNNGEVLTVDLTCAVSGMTKNFNLSWDDCTGELVIEYNGEKQVLTGFVTKKNLESKIMTKAITDGTITGDGTSGKPLSLSQIERTGFYRPAARLIDTINGEELPECKEKGDRYLTYEYTDEYGKLYNYGGVSQISELLTNGWRIPTKADWDNMLNGIEPCTYRNHQSTKCHIELGKFAGKKLKDKGTWCGEEYYSACTSDTDDEYYLDPENCPKDKPVSPTGSNDYGFGIKPAGYAVDDEDKIKQCEWGAFWTSTQTMPGAQSDYYVKIFENKRSGVVQATDCPQHYYSLRLVKDYDGSNAHESEYFEKLGKSYPTVLLPTVKTEDNPNNNYGMSVWTAVNIDFETSNKTWDEIQNIEVGSPTCISPFYEDNMPEKKRVYFINDWNGKFWERRELIEGDTIVLNTPVESGYTDDTEYRIVNGELVPTDDLVYKRVIDRVLSIIHEIESRIDSLTEALDEEIERAKKREDEIEQGYQEAVYNEQQERISGDTALGERIDKEVQDRIDGDNALSGEIDTAKQELYDAIAQETSARTDVDNQLWDAIAKEASARTDVDNQLWSGLAQEASARTDVDNQLWNGLAQEASARTDVDNALQESIDQEESARIDADSQLWNSIAQESSARTDVDNQLWNGLAQEASARTEADKALFDKMLKGGTEYTIKAYDGKTVLASNDGKEENSITLNIVSDFGEI